MLQRCTVVVYRDITWMSKWTSLVKTLSDLSIAMILDCKRMNARKMLKQNTVCTIYTCNSHKVQSAGQKDEG